MLKLNLLLLCVVIILCGTSAYFYNSFKESEKDNSRLKKNEQVYINGIHMFKTKLDNSVIKTSELNRTISEFENDKTNVKLIDKIKELNIKIKDVTAAITVKQGIDTSIKNTKEIIYIKECMEFTHPYAYIKICKDSTKINISDSLYILDSKRREFVNKRSKLFFIRWFQDKRTVIDLSVSHTNKLIKTNDFKKQIIINDKRNL